ncbi:MAG TPA: ABC transporter ATP-binding protein [Solirubrobacteraceae bacterium]|jgi:iron(III) transport system ATP-binding protein
MSAIELRSVAKRFAATPVLTDVDLTVAEGSITAVLGASGSGKTTLLRLIAGFEQLDGGTLKIGGRVVDDGQRTVSPQHRGVGYVPQEGALFPHLTVVGNIVFGLARRDRAKADELLELTGLADLRKRYPHQLSGGQQQRVALARALAIGPEVVLLDEPFSALDASLRTELRRDVERILHDTGTTTILVTHDQDEALGLAGQVALLADGRVRAAASPRELYRDPPDLGTATAIGEANILTALATTGYADCVLGSVPIRDDGAAVDGPSRLLLRPEQLVLHLTHGKGSTAATVVELQYHGHDALARLRLRDHDTDTLLARVPGELALEPGQAVWIEVVGHGLTWSTGRVPEPRQVRVA